MGLRVPVWDIARATVKYIATKQIDKRPITLKMLQNRIGISYKRIVAEIESEKVKYVFIEHDPERKMDLFTTEILIYDLPDSLAYDAEIDKEALKEAYFAVAEMAPPKTKSMVYPFHRNKITDRQFEILEKYLIKRADVVEEGKKQDYSEKFLRRALGEKGRFKPPSNVWRPYIHKRQRYYHREILNHLDECEKMGDPRFTREWRRKIREKKMSNKTLDEDSN